MSGGSSMTGRAGRRASPRMIDIKSRAVRSECSSTNLADRPFPPRSCSPSAADVARALLLEAREHALSAVGRPERQALVVSSRYFHPSIMRLPASS